MKLVTGKSLSKAPARRVERLSDIESRIEPLIAFMDENQGKFPGRHESCYALHDAQIDYDGEEYNPFNFFVVSDNMAPKKKDGFTFDHGRVMINPKILSTPEKIERDVPKRKVEKVGNEAKITLETVKEKLDNSILLPEGCMSFPFRDSKKCKRFYEIEVEYQIPAKGLLNPSGLKTVKETLTGLKAHIFQHEFDHGQGKNIFH